MKQILISGLASQKIVQTIPVSIENYPDTILNFLTTHNIPVASSCGGDGVCQKCYVQINNEKILSCQLTIGELFIDSNTVTLSFSYL